MKRSLKIRTAIGIAGIALTLTVISLCVSYAVYARTLDDHYATVAQQVADTAVLGIDGDKIEQYYEEFLKLEPTDPLYNEKLEAIKDDDYDRMLNYLYGVRKANNALYLYVEVYDFDKMLDTYIMDADKKETACNLGYIDVISDDLEVYKDSLDVGIPPFFTNTEEFGSLVTTGRPIYNSDGKVVALVLVDISMKKVWTDRNGFLLLISIIMLLAAAALVYLFVYMSNKMIVLPINRMAHAAASYISDKDSLEDGLSAIEQLDVKTGDEIENLCVSVKKMEQDIRTYIQNLTAVTAEKERIGAELEIATQIQASMLPCIFPAFPAHSEFDIYATMEPAKEVGGDFYDFFLIDETHLAVVMADVSGKGVPAALFMVIAKTLIKNHAQTGLPANEVFNRVNRQLCENNDADLFVTAWMGILEIGTGKFTYVNAGHNPPLLRRKGGSYEYLHSRPGFVLAGMDTVRYRINEMELLPGDQLYLYTDGVTEAINVDEELWGEDRLLECINSNAALPPHLLLPAIKAGLDSFVGDAPQFDDITMLNLTISEEVQSPMKSITVAANVSELDRVLAFIEGELEQQSCPMGAQMEIGIAVEEIFVNIAHYAYNPVEGKATIRCEIAENPLAITIQFLDNGVPYNPLDKADPNITLDADERDIGGLGIFMVKKSMDCVDYRYDHGKNILTIKKSF
ncbi:MAG: SpoIIE family protein phosphatase [Oscillospiraceae bacterium]